MSLRWATRGVLFAALAPLGIAACGGSDRAAEISSPVPTTPPARTTQPAASADGPASVEAGRSRLGRILVDVRGRTLYFFKSDTPRKAACTSDYLNCTTTWPPLMTTGHPVGRASVESGLLDSFHRTKPAGSQVRYKGHPLYLYSEDRQPGDVKGQGLFQSWYVLSPSGHAITKK